MDFRFAFFFFAALRAGFFAAIFLTVALFFLLFAVIGIETTPSRVSGGATRTPKNDKEYEEVRLMKQYQRLPRKKLKPGDVQKTQ